MKLQQKLICVQTEVWTTVFPKVILNERQFCCCFIGSHQSKACDIHAFKANVTLPVVLKLSSISRNQYL